MKRCAFLLCLFLTGCFPYHYTTRPGFDGTVIDVVSGKPVSGASISFGRKEVIEIGKTSTSGTFAIPAIRKWGIWWLPQDVFNTRDMLVIYHPDLPPHQKEIIWSMAMTGKNTAEHLGVILLNGPQPSTDMLFVREQMETPTYSITIECRCPEGDMVCNDVRYLGINKQTGRILALSGFTWHTFGADGVTPSCFQGYRFKDGDTGYFVTAAGWLEITEGDKMLLQEKGDWIQISQ